MVSTVSFFMFSVFFFYTTDLDKNNTEIKSELNQCTTELYVTYGDQIGETKKLKITHIYVYVNVV